MCSIHSLGPSLILKSVFNFAFKTSTSTALKDTVDKVPGLMGNIPTADLSLPLREL